MVSENRRKILKAAASAPLLSLLNPHSSMGFTKETNQPGIAVQLYTIREAIAIDPFNSLKKLHDIGFRQVETAFWPEGVSLQQASDWLRASGLEAISSHIEIPQGNFKKVFIETAKAYDCKTLIWHGWPEDKRYGSEKGVQELIKLYNEASKFAQSNGLTFGLHNHWWEFRNKTGNTFPFDLLHRELDPEIFFELDVYWIKVAGMDPVTAIQRFGKRVRLLHMKDGPAVYHDSLATDNPDPMTALGKGTLNIPAILQASEHVKYLVIEMDKTSSDVFVALKESFDFLSNKIK